MKKIILHLLFILFFVSCQQPVQQKSTPPISQIFNTVNQQKFEVIHLTDKVKGGLSKIVIDDTTVILIYMINRGMEPQSCTMIKIK